MSKKELKLISSLINKHKDNISKIQISMNSNKNSNEDKEQCMLLIRKELDDIRVLKRIYKKIVAIDTIKKSYVGENSCFSNKERDSLASLGIDIF